MLTLEKQQVLRSSFFIASKIQLNLPFLEYFLDSSVTLTLCLDEPQLRLAPFSLPWADSSNVGQKFWPALSLRMVSLAAQSLLLPQNCLSHGRQPQETLACIPSCSLLSANLGKHHPQAPTLYLVSPFRAHLPCAGSLSYVSQGALTLTNGRLQNYCFCRLNWPWHVCVSLQMRCKCGEVVFLCLY